MSMNRLKSIDIIRGLSLCWMFIAHLQFWWLQPGNLWFLTIEFAFLDVIGSSAFIFVSGLSTAIAYRNRIRKIETVEGYDMKSVKYEYFFRFLIIFIIAIIYNLCIAIAHMRFEMIWSWYILLTIGVCLALTWPLLKTPKWFRIFVGGLFWVFDIFILEYLTPYQGESTFNGLLYHIFYNSINLSPILIFFTFFLIGTVVGDILSDSFLIENENERKKLVKNNLIYPSLIIGAILIIIGILLPFPDQKHYYIGREINVSQVLLDFPHFMIRGSFIWRIYALGFLLVFFSVLLCFDTFQIIKTEKSYRFLYYFSYYSLTVFLVHNLMVFPFYKQLTLQTIWIFIAGTIIFWGIMLRAIYKSKWRNKISVKIYMGRLSSYLTERILTTSEK